MSFCGSIYFLMHHAWDAISMWVELMVLLALIGVAVSAYLGDSHPMVDFAYMSTTAVFAAGLAIMLLVFASSVFTLAPASWFARLPAAEATFFKLRMEHAHSPLSVGNFVSLQDKYSGLYNPHDSLIAQMGALK